MDNEIWKPVVGFEGLYEVSNLGRVKSLFYKGTIRRDLILKGNRDKDGYKFYVLYRNMNHKHLRGHRIVLFAFLENKYGKPFVNHKNGIKDDNRVENLEWVTARENTLHSRDILKNKFGNTQRGINHKNSKKIIQYSKQGDFIRYWDSIADAARFVGCYSAQITGVCKGHKKSCKGFIWKYN